MRICIFGAASPTIDEKYKIAVTELGEALAKQGHSLVFGGGNNGLMGAAARGFTKGGGKILAVIPHFFFEDDVEVLYPYCDEVLKTDTMRERKQLMEDNADAFIIVPGGIGTFEEFYEILTSKQLCRHRKPIVIYNLYNYYDETQAVLKASIEKNFVGENCVKLYNITDNMQEVIDYILVPPDETLTVKDLKEG